MLLALGSGCMNWLIFKSFILNNCKFIRCYRVGHRKSMRTLSSLYNYILIVKPGNAHWCNVYVYFCVTLITQTDSPNDHHTDWSFSTTKTIPLLLSAFSPSSPPIVLTLVVTVVFQLHNFSFLRLLHK